MSAAALRRLIDKIVPAWNAPSSIDENLTPEMQAVLDRLIDKIYTADIDRVTDENIFVENVFTPEIYAKVLELLPDDQTYDYIEHPDAVLPDGRKTRKLLDLTDTTLTRLRAESRDFWQGMKGVLTSPILVRAITHKFRNKINAAYGRKWPGMVPVPLFYRDLPGYRIGIHPDAPFKVATMQFYFAKDLSQMHLGTSFHVKEGDKFREHKTNQFKRNPAYAFVRTDNSWHSVKQMGPNEGARDTLALTIYQKGTEYKSAYGPAN